MAGKRLPMTKILEILPLHWVLGLTVRDTAQALRVSTGVVSTTAERASAISLTDKSASELPYEAPRRALPGAAASGRVRRAGSGLGPSRVRAPRPRPGQLPGRRGPRGADR